MPAQAICQFHITSIQEVMYIMAMLPLAVGGRTHKDMYLLLVNIFDTGHAIEEYSRSKNCPNVWLFCKD